MAKEGEMLHKRLRALWPLVCSIAAPALLVILDATPMGPDIVFVMLLTPGLLILWIVAAIFAFVLLVKQIRTRSYRSASSYAVLPVVVAACMCSPFGFLRCCNYGGSALNLLVMQHRYMSEINNLPSRGEPKLLVIDRGGMVWASEGFIYDESDEVKLSPTQQSPGWKARAHETELTCGYRAVHLWGHFYYGSFAC